MLRKDKIAVGILFVAWSAVPRGITDSDLPFLIGLGNAIFWTVFWIWKD